MSAIRENPEDDGPRLIFADWLEEESAKLDNKGYALWAEFIRVSLQLKAIRVKREAQGYTEEDRQTVRAIHGRQAVLNRDENFFQMFPSLPKSFVIDDQEFKIHYSYEDGFPVFRSSILRPNRDDVALKKILSVENLPIFSLDARQYRVDIDDENLKKIAILNYIIPRDLRNAELHAFDPSGCMCLTPGGAQRATA